MEYPKSWERDMAAWVDGASEPDTARIVVNEEDGPTAFVVKNVNWAATLRANWKKAAMAAAAVLAVAGIVIMVVKACRKK